MRDELLELPVYERDWVVVGSTEHDMLDLGYRQVDTQFPVFIHPETGDEYALARREVKTGPGYKGFRVEAGPDVSLEEDLARRDLTINAIAQSPDGILIDPFGGRADLDAGWLRHITPAFAEDPVRLLRVARFAAKLGRWGFRVAHDTHHIMRQMSASEEVHHLRFERVWSEMRKSLETEQPWRFFEVLNSVGTLAVILPELAHAMEVSEGHGNAQVVPPVAALKKVAIMSDELAVRFAAVFTPVLDRSNVDTLCTKLRPQGDCCDLLRRSVAARSQLDHLSVAQGSDLLSFFNEERAFQVPCRFAALLTVCRAQGDYERIVQRLESALSAAAAIQAKDLLSLGLKGAQMRLALDERRAAAIDQRLDPINR